MLTTHFVRYFDGRLYCRLSQTLVPVEGVGAQFVRPFNNASMYRLLMASGITQQQQLNVHSLAADSPTFPLVSPTPLSLIAYQQESGRWLPKRADAFIFSQFSPE